MKWRDEDWFCMRHHVTVYNHVLPHTMYYRIPCITAYYRILPHTTTYYRILPHTTAYYHVTWAKLFHFGVIQRQVVIDKAHKLTPTKLIHVGRGGGDIDCFDMSHDKARVSEWVGAMSGYEGGIEISPSATWRWRHVTSSHDWDCGANLSTSVLLWCN